jgi:hypothetical protein
MKNTVPTRLNELTLSPKRLFLLDSIGGFLSAGLLLTLLAGFYDAFRMPQTVVYRLAAIALIYAVYSLCCFYFVVENARLFLLIIAVANILYCLLTIALVLYFHRQVTVLCKVYFFLELAIVGLLIKLELEAASKHKRS